MTGSRTVRRGAFAVLCLATVVAGGLYLSSATRRADERSSRPVAAGSAPVAALDEYVDGPHLVFRSTAPDVSYGKVGIVPADDPDEAPALGSTDCARVDAVPGGGVLCLEEDFGLVSPYHAVLLDERLGEVWRSPLQGIPSRVRVAPSGELASITVFVSGHSYAEVGFSTLTTLVELETGDTVTDLERFAVTKDGQPFSAVDFNFWGVTFQDDGNRFYATLGTGGRTYLVEGDAGAETAQVLRDEVECPSLSPDGTRVAYKKRVDGSAVVRWRVHVLDLETMEERPLAETRHVDDQVEWLDDDRIAYFLENESDPAVQDTWVVPADGTGTPALFRSASSSLVIAG